LTKASGDVVVIQDADLKYDPNDWSRMLPLIVERKVADVVYGSRFMAGRIVRCISIITSATASSHLYLMYYTTKCCHI
jgi:hypothetical protein